MQHIRAACASPRQVRLPNNTTKRLQPISREPTGPLFASTRHIPLSFVICHCLFVIWHCIPPPIFPPVNPPSLTLLCRRS